ncbi:hypothetical protein CBS101457_003244 [Exobasidium rhododendri]|nr:hypothetical protein CBS101457_003244 [Exobasidium rhododendri]
MGKPRKTLIIGVGGPTSSGKTTLAKHLFSLLPSGKCTMLHQDDFALPEEQLPWNEGLQARDWDSPVGTIDYRRMEEALRYFREHGELPAHHSSHDHLNENSSLPLEAESTSHWKSTFQEALKKGDIEKILIADGFLLYYDERVRRELDVRLFLRCNKSTLIKRRGSRGGYATAEGTVWQDPPGYFEHIIWPGYVQAHKNFFEDGDVEKGRLVKPSEEVTGDGAPVKDLILFEAESMPLEDIVNISSKELERGVAK